MSEANAQAVDAAPLSVDAAVAALLPPEDTQEAPEAATPEPEIEATPEAEDAPEPEEAIEGEGEEGEPEKPAIAAPHSWDAEAKARFAELPHDVQELIVRRETERDTATAKALQEAAETRKRAEAEAGEFTKLKERLDTLIPEAEASFRSKWPEKIDWVATLNQCVEQFGVEEGRRQYLVLKEQHEQDTRQIAAAKAAQQEAEAKAFDAFVKAEFEKLKTVEPELTDPQHGAERRQAVTKFLLDMGIPAEHVRGAGAVEYKLAYDAMRYRDGLQKAKAALKAPPKPIPAKPAVKPASAQAGSPAERSAQQIKNRFAQTKSVDDAVALLLAK
jgi:hypothetical protein